MQEFKYKEHYQYLTDICLNLTDSCNLACRYCFVEQHPHYMSLQTAKDSIDFLMFNLKKKQELRINKEKASITFFGGEPMLLWDEVIVPLIFYTEEKYPDKFSFSMTTNGTLLNKEKIDFMFEHNIYPHLSIDGAKYTQDKNRPCRNGSSSFDMLYPNISYLLEKFPNVTYRATIDQNTVEKTFENYCFADYLGFKNIFMIPNGREKWSIENQNKLKNELEKIYIYIANCFLNNEYPINFSTINESFEWVLNHDINILDPRVKIECSRSCDRCGMGTSFGSIGYDGNIYGCQEQNSKDEKNIFLIGNIYNGGIDKKLHSNLLSKYEEVKISKCENEKLCENCKLRNICINYACPSTSWDLFKEFHIDNEIHCLWNQYLFDNATVLMSYFVENKNSLFKEFLEKYCKFNEYFKKED